MEMDGKYTCYHAEHEIGMSIDHGASQKSGRSNWKAENMLVGRMISLLDPSPVDMFNVGGAHKHHIIKIKLGRKKATYKKVDMGKAGFSFGSWEKAKAFWEGSSIFRLHAWMYLTLIIH